ncbi:MAG: hypothetical protein EAZ57_11105 [Cytophagales bacterium]|nr:MAG: hypothetical protein EAZ67_11765 [Cytophagales bacterium]TAF59424.1 MAG: hypothetical protein EAZ57_11105 [Cytophagales bacterium]
MKMLFILYLYTVALDSPEVRTNEWPDDELAGLYSCYFETEPTLRGTRIIHLIDTSFTINCFYAFNIIYDLSSISRKNVKYDFDIGSFGGEINFLTPIHKLKQRIARTQKRITKSSILGCKNRQCACKSKDPTTVLTVSEDDFADGCPSSGVISRYVELCLKMRIIFLDKFCTKMCLSTIRIIQKDLNSLLNIETEEIKEKNVSEIKKLCGLYLAEFENKKR